MQSDQPVSDALEASATPLVGDSVLLHTAADGAILMRPVILLDHEMSDSTFTSFAEGMIPHGTRSEFLSVDGGMHHDSGGRHRPLTRE
jgi:hypothetical protein